MQVYLGVIKRQEKSEDERLSSAGVPSLITITNQWRDEAAVDLNRPSRGISSIIVGKIDESKQTHVTRPRAFS